MQIRNLNFDTFRMWGVDLRAPIVLLFSRQWTPVRFGKTYRPWADGLSRNVGNCRYTLRNIPEKRRSQTLYPVNRRLGESKMRSKSMFCPLPAIEPRNFVCTCSNLVSIPTVLTALSVLFNNAFSGYDYTASVMNDVCVCVCVCVCGALRGETKNSKRDLYQFHFVHHKSHMACPGIEPKSPQWLTWG
jgi:hypothetical protein